MKHQQRSRRSFPVSSLDSLEPRKLLTMAATAQLPAVSVELGAVLPAVNLDGYFQDADASADYAIVNTNLGTIPVVLTPKTTPTMVTNFLSDVNKGDYKNTLVQASVPGTLWQTGGYKVDSDSTITATPTTAAASSASTNEVGGPNVRGTIAMIRPANGGAGLTNQFYFNESDSNAAALDNQVGGSTVFGHVVGQQGLTVLDAIGAVPVPTSSPLKAPLDKAPLQFYTAGQPVQAYNLTTIDGVSTASEYYETVSDNPTVAKVSVVGIS